MLYAVKVNGSSIDFSEAHGGIQRKLAPTHAEDILSLPLLQNVPLMHTASGVDDEPSLRYSKFAVAKLIGTVICNCSANFFTFAVTDRLVSAADPTYYKTLFLPLSIT